MTINNNSGVHTVKMLSNVLIRKNGKYLLINRAKNKAAAPNVVHLFGGHIEHCENPFEAAKREIKEEVGIKLKNIKLKAVVTEIKQSIPETPDWTIFHFSADYCSGDIIKSKEGELMELAKNKLLNSNMLPSLKYIINHLLANDERIMFTTFLYDKNGIFCKVNKASFV